MDDCIYGASTPTGPHPAAIARDREMAERRLFDLITALGHVFGPPTETAIHEAVVTVKHLQADAEFRLEQELSMANGTIEQLRQQNGEVIGQMVQEHTRINEYLKGLEAKTKPSARPKYVQDLRVLTNDAAIGVRRVVRSQG